MSYQVLARKWRPKDFSAMVGQEHVLRALINALDTGRVHHAFLFTGTRGVGKTTIARILAKSLNCEQGAGSKPCGECSACREIDEGRFVDLIEVDAASRTKVEDTRDLLDNVQYAPTRGRYKVYLIDEVHMLSNHSFNALLKTLEEPPPHVKFLLATTDPQKLPVTILSRCLQFNLRRLAPEMIRGHLQHIIEAEQIAAETPALQQLARAADGSMRDALSLLDQAIAFGNGRLSETDVRAMLGTIEQTHIYQLLHALAGGDGKEVLQVVAELSMQVPDYAEVLAELITALHHIAILQQVPAAWDDAMGDKAELEAIAAQLSPEDVQLYYQIGLIGRRDINLAPEPRNGLEMVLLRMLAFRPAGAESDNRSRTGTGNRQPEKKNSASGASAGPIGQDSEPKVQRQVEQAISHEEQPVVQKPPVAPPVETLVVNEPAPSGGVTLEPDTEWAAITEQLGAAGIVQQMAMNCVIHEQQEDNIVLVLAPECANLYSKEREERLQELLLNFYNKPVRLAVRIEQPGKETPAAQQLRRQRERQEAAKLAIQNDMNVQKIVETFNARLEPELIRPIE
ncbi:MAG: DNA polymerase III subunit gamma/tau [Gammaproteobacteria bacterium]|nr:DNA polymerase III subunit gamma/tau [Gammaproteobacteria bacterium]MDH5652192.1 DNA polymerase III subunit gamma/tau [Gammaproteobacteria bacterium]